MKKKYGRLWWEKGVPEYVRLNSEKKHIDQLHCPLINRLDVRDVHRIILEKRNWDTIFRNNIPSREYVRDLINNFADYRNIVKHDTMLLDDKQIKKLEGILDEIEKCTQQ